MKFLTSLKYSLVLGVLSASVAKAESYVLDPVHSVAVFKINHLGVSDFYGRFSKLEGTFNIDKSDVTKSAANVTVLVDSVDTADQKRDSHLKSPDFFNAKQFPSMSFKSSSVEKKSETEYLLKGELSIKGISKPVSLLLVKGGEGVDPWGKERIGFNTEFEINRSDFDITFMPDKLGDKVKLMLALEGVKQ